MKAVLVIDVEEKDIGRKVNYVSVQGGGLSYIVGTMGDDARLRPLPERISTNEYGYMTPYGKVWNACIDAIEGETE